MVPGQWVPSFPKSDVLAFQERLWTAHRQAITDHINKSTIASLAATFPGSVFHCEDKQASSLGIFCPVFDISMPFPRHSTTRTSSNSCLTTKRPSSLLLRTPYAINLEYHTLGHLEKDANYPRAILSPRRKNLT